MSKEEVDIAFTGAQDDTMPRCYVCTNYAQYEIFHKQDDATIPDIPNQRFYMSALHEKGIPRQQAIQSKTNGGYYI
ncbi:hypothetical protein sp82g_1 [Bacillus phage SP82G]|nr:hypothetical protein sp82g_1 [Bacillus phage SP82G]